ncbi:hypothetical protein MKW98_017078 [Papaver atlanticum]|uniref:Uncharacterized protein n=1 Tax=Papaver atlanticum TaxID=357466 RepID=A0AAD4XYK5_9MAGN|nr:hypothetical protein MKW98_017078 [Papaver atlanticum]
MVTLFPPNLQAFGMELLRKRDNPEYKFTIAMMGYGPGPEDCYIHLSTSSLQSARVHSQSDAGTPLIWVDGHGQPPAY